MLRPKARPDDVKPISGDSAKERRGGGGGGKGGDMATSREQIDRSMNDKRFGYFDPYTGKRVSALIDMINGGGMNAAGSDFEGGPYSGILNLLGVTPYGQDNERTGMPEGAYRGGDIDDARRFNFGGPSGGVSDMRPQARPELSSRNNAEPINAYGMAPALPSRSNAEPINAYGMAPALPSRVNAEPVNPYQAVPAVPSLSDSGTPHHATGMKIPALEPVSGMPTPMPTQDRFGPDGPQTADDFAVIHGQIQQDLGIGPMELYGIMSNNPDQYDRLVSMYSRYGGYEMPRSITPQPAAQPSGQSLRDVVRSAYSVSPFSASSLF